MEILKTQLLEPEEADYLRYLIVKSDNWLDGKISAGKLAAAVKNNLQFNHEDPVHEEVSNKIFNKFTDNTSTFSFSMAKMMSPVIISKSGLGQGYGWHLDNPRMTINNSTFSTHLSYTVSLTDPDEYDGGELVIRQQSVDTAVKLNKGEIVIYPTTQIHQVKEVTKGDRIVCVGWVSSDVSDNEARYSIFQLSQTIRYLVDTYGNSPEVLRLSNATNNLIRKFS